MKPAWKNAPKWANYLAQNYFGEWTWFQNKPEPGITCWMPKGKQENALSATPDWRDTLEKRPGK